MSGTLAQSAARGMFFTLGAQGVKIVLQLASVAILSRLLTPNDYGLLAIVLVIVGAGEIFRDFGLTAASIQAPTLRRGQRDNLFWLNAAIGATLCIIVFFVSWPATWITGLPQIQAMVQCLSLLFILNGLATQHRASLLRALRFKAIAVVDIAAAVIGLGLAIPAALGGLGYWALVLQQLVVTAVGMAGAVALARWWPRLPDRTESIRDFIGFGWNLVATNLLMYAGSQLDTVLVGARFGTGALGLYNRAFQLVMTPLNQVRAPINSVAQPVFARVQGDQPRFERYVVAGQLALGYGIGIVLAVLAALSTPVVAVMLGPRWLDAAPILCLFAIAAMLSNISMIGYWVYVSRGLTAQLFRYTMVSLAIKVVCLVTGSFFGVVGVAAGFAIAPALSWPISLWWLSRLTPMPVRELYAGAARILAVCLAAAFAAAGAGVIAAGGLAPVAQLGIGGVAGLLAAAFFLVFPLFRNDAATLVWFARLMLNRKK